MMEREEIIKALRRLKVETGSIACLGCGYEHNCSTHGCAIIRDAEIMLDLDAKEVASLRAQLTDLLQTDVAPVVHAHWIDTGRSDDNDNYDFVCCRCKHTDIHSRQVKVPYCWFCGARMDAQEAQHDN